MRIKIQQFLFAKNHSWALVGQNIGRELLKRGHSVEFISTDGIVGSYIPEDLRAHIKVEPTGTYDCQISYTAPHNWPQYLAHGSKNRFAIWNYEYNAKQTTDNFVALLRGFAKFYKAADYILPSSEFSKDVFKNMMFPEEKLIVVPHGINLQDFSNKNKTNIQSKKKIKILLNIAQPHKRKAIPLALESFGKAFTKNDDVCLIAKVFKKNHASQMFDVNFDQMYQTFHRKFPNHANVEFLYDYVPNIAELYNACDINFSATYAECWHLPSLEAMAAGKLNVVPRYGGQLDFCNDENCLLINGDIVRAPKDHQYWEFNPFAVHYQINTDEAAIKLRLAADQYDSIMTKFQSRMQQTVSQYTWENAVSKLLTLCT